jgi:hypothetical protein
MGKEDVETLPDSMKKCNLIVVGLIYFSIGTDTLNAGTLEAKCETIIEDLYTLNETWATSIQSLDVDSKRAVESIEIIGVQPYINTGFPNRGELEFELRIIYYRS